MTVSPALSLINWYNNHKKELLLAHNVDDIKRVYMKTVHPDGNITEFQKKVLQVIKWDVIYNWICEETGKEGLI